jgi:hypothetical protein
VVFIHSLKSARASPRRGVRFRGRIGVGLDELAGRFLGEAEFLNTGETAAMRSALSSTPCGNSTVAKSYFSGMTDAGVVAAAAGAAGAGVGAAAAALREWQALQRERQLQEQLRMQRARRRALP